MYSQNPNSTTSLPNTKFVFQKQILYFYVVCFSNEAEARVLALISFMLKPLCAVYMVSFETTFDSKQLKLEPNFNTIRNKTFCFSCFASIPKQRVSMFRLNRNKQKTNQKSSSSEHILVFF
jgi:hypothetical protein